MTNTDSASTIPQGDKQANPPDRKIWVGFISGAVTGFIAWATKEFLHYDLPVGVLTMLPVVIGYAVSYWVPPSVQDVLKRVSNEIVAQAVLQQGNPTSVAGIQREIVVAKIDEAKEKKP